MLNLSVVIPTAGNFDRLLPCLHSLEAQNLPAEDFEVILVANQGLESINNIIKQNSFKNVRLEKTDDPRVNHLRNRGAAVAAGKWLFFLDDDCRVTDPDHLQKRLKLHQDLGEKSAVAGSYKQSKNCTYFGRCYNLIAHLWLLSKVTGEQHVSAFLGGNMSIATKYFSQAGLQDKIAFDEELIMGGEELAMTSQLLKLKIAIFWSPDFSVTHSARHHGLLYLRRAWNHGRAKVRMQAQKKALRFDLVTKAQGCLISAYLKQKIFKKLKSVGHLMYQILCQWREFPMVALYLIVVYLGQIYQNILSPISMTVGVSGSLPKKSVSI